MDMGERELFVNLQYQEKNTNKGEDSSKKGEQTKKNLSQINRHEVRTPYDAGAHRNAN